MVVFMTCFVTSLHPNTDAEAPKGGWFARFSQCECGAATSDWAVATAAVVFISIGLLTDTSSSTNSAATSTGGYIAEQDFIEGKSLKPIGRPQGNDYASNDTGGLPSGPGGGASGGSSSGGSTGAAAGGNIGEPAGGAVGGQTASDQPAAQDITDNANDDTGQQSAGQTGPASDPAAPAGGQTNTNASPAGDDDIQTASANDDQTGADDNASASADDGSTSGGGDDTTTAAADLPPDCYRPNGRIRRRCR